MTIKALIPIAAIMLVLNGFYVNTAKAEPPTELAEMLGNDGETFDVFGRSVALDGEGVVIGASGDTDNGEATGSAYVFTFDGTNWTQVQKLTASDGAAFDRFGFFVALDGNTAIIGTGFGGEAAYVFTFDGATWSEVQKLTPSDAAANDRLGECVGLNGGTAIIGSINDNGDGNGDSSGSAYVFEFDGTEWVEPQKFLGDPAQFGSLSFFGLALYGDRALIGAAGEGEDNYTGAVYSFVPSGSTWAREAKFTASDSHEGSRFGIGVAMSGNTALIGAHTHDHASSPTRITGAAYVFSLVADDEGPETAAVLATANPAVVNTDVRLIADVDDWGTGGSTIAAASYIIDGAASVPMTARDGSFDDVVEAVTSILSGFTSTGVHTICVSGTDASGNTGNETCVLLAVYDPIAGFITGGGWINSPWGGYTPNPSLTGKANFGFVSKYKKGAHTPTGVTEFQFKVADLNFHSNTYEWLVVAGARAQFKGVGTINGGDNYGFMLTAIDGAIAGGGGVDRFRIKI